MVSKSLASNGHLPCPTEPQLGGVSSESWIPVLGLLCRTLTLSRVHNPGLVSKKYSSEPTANVLVFPKKRQHILLKEASVHPSKCLSAIVNPGK